MAHNDSSHGSPSGSHGSGKPSYDDIDTSQVLVVGIASAIITVLCVVVVQGMTYQMNRSIIQERSYDVAVTKSIEAINEQRNELQAKPEKNRKSIQQAMQETVAAFSNRQQ
jgi:low affinity Fe/Cu permease